MEKRENRRNRADGITSTLIGAPRRKMLKATARIAALALATGLSGAPRETLLPPEPTAPAMRERQVVTVVGPAFTGGVRPPSAGQQGEFEGLLNLFVTRVRGGKAFMKCRHYDARQDRIIETEVEWRPNETLHAITPKGTARLTLRRVRREDSGGYSAVFAHSTETRRANLANPAEVWLESRRGTLELEVGRPHRLPEELAVHLNSPLSRISFPQRWSPEAARALVTNLGQAGLRYDRRRNGLP